jgi:hypothetical protein
MFGSIAFNFEKDDKMPPPINGGGMGLLAVKSYLLV